MLHPDFLTKTHPMSMLDNLQENLSCISAKSSHQDFGCLPLSNNARLLCNTNVCIQPYVVFDGLVFLDDDVFIGPYTMLRGPLYIGKGSKIGPNCEITRCFIGCNTKICHKNIVPDAVIGSDVWFAGGVILCNTRMDKKTVQFTYEGVTSSRQVFSALVDDHVSLGVNVTVMPGSHLKEKAVVYGPITLGGIIEGVIK